MIKPGDQNIARDGLQGGSDTIDGSGEDTFFKGQGVQPPGFRATGKGLNVTHPDFSANAMPGRATANAVLLETDGSDKIYLFVDSVSSNWQVQGSFGQTNLSRTFYPHSFVQGEWTITGQMANQYEYDLLVMFIERHQRHMLETAQMNLGSLPYQVIGAEFMLFRPDNSESIGAQSNAVHYKIIPGQAPHPLSANDNTNKFHVMLAITNMAAGHERFMFAPAFTLTAVVIWDFWRDSGYVDFDIMEFFNGPIVFGDLTSGVPGLHPPGEAGVNEPPHKKAPPNNAPPHNTDPGGVGR